MYCLDSLLTDDGKVVSSTHRLRSALKKHYFSVSGTHFSQSLDQFQGLTHKEGLGKLKKIYSPHRVSNPRPSAL
jgi:hypothetical protein